MQKRPLVRGCILVTALALVFNPAHSDAQVNSAATTAGVDRTSPEYDGEHDFDFEIGTWHVHVSLVLHPLTGSKEWVQYDGTSVIRKIWNGRANLVELEVDGPAGRIQGLSLRLYNPHSHQWNISWATSSEGMLGRPMFGEFKNGRGEFFDQEFLNGRAICVRYVFSDITPSSVHFEQSFSDAGGKNWEVNFIETYTRVRSDSDKTK